MNDIVIEAILAVLLIASIAPYLVSYIQKHRRATTGKCFNGCHVGVVITNRRYSSGAVELATATNIIL